MSMEMVEIEREGLRELIIAGQNLRDMCERLSKERDELQKDLTLTKVQLEEAWGQIK
jgi:hypothetical protein